MSIFLFRPHIDGPVGITTPDLIIDRLWVDNQATATNLLTHNSFWQSADDTTATCALALTEAGAGTLISPALIMPNGQICIARRAWRWKYIDTLTANGHAIDTSVKQQCEALSSNLKRCQMGIITLPEQANQLTLGWGDKQLDHKLHIELLADLVEETEKPRYSVGPMRHPVDHFV